MNAVQVAEKFLGTALSRGANIALEEMSRTIGTDLTSIMAVKEAMGKIANQKQREGDPGLYGVLMLAKNWLHFHANIADHQRREEGPPSAEMMANIRDRMSAEKSLKRQLDRYMRSKAARITNPHELREELGHILASCQGPERPSRQDLAAHLRRLASQIE